MNQTKLKGNPVHLKGDVPEAGQTAPNFTYVKQDLSEESLHDHGGKIKVIIAVPSLDTGICQLEAKRFNKELSHHGDVIGLIVSKDLPFAMSRFCAAEGIENVQTASDFRGDFSEKYNTLIMDGPMMGLSARVVFVLDKDNKITYTQITDDITVEPNYEEALKAVEKLKN
jgi:thiol peroxidase